MSDKLLNDEERTKNTIFCVIVNSLNIIGGTSFLGLPFALKQSGLIAGICILVFLSYLTEITHRLIVECSKFHPVLRFKNIESYEDLVSFPYGKVGEGMLMFSIFVVSFGATVEYIIMIKDMLPVLLGYENESTFIVLVTWGLCVVPLTLLKNLSSLVFISGLSLVMSTFLIVVMFNSSPIQENVADHGGIMPLIKHYSFRPNVFATVSIFTEALAWQHGTFTVFHSLQKPTLFRWTIVTTSVNFLACIMYACVAVPGYLGYLDETDGDIFINLPEDRLCSIARAFFVFICIMTYPIEMLIARDVTYSFYCRNETLEYDTHSSTIEDSSWWRENIVHGKELVFVIGLNIIAVALGLYLQDLGIVLALVGAIGGSTACFIMPGLVYLGVNGGEFMNLTKRWIASNKTDCCTGTPEIDTATIQSDDSFLVTQKFEGPKPLWFYLLGFPIWLRISLFAVEQMKAKVMINGDFVQLSSDPSPSSMKYKSNCIDTCQLRGSNALNQTSCEVVRPTADRFLTAILLLVFGFVNMFVSLLVSPS